MNTSQMFITISIAVLAVVACLAFFLRKNRRRDKLSPVAGFAFSFIVAGILFGQTGLVGYGFLALGVVLAIVDIFMRSRTN
jgi:lipopolysaccharide export LptBFGC system permease protein LptF